jgi:DNA gyrase subunit B
MVAFLDRQAAAPAGHEIIGFEREDPRMSGTMEVAWRWHGSAHQRMRSFANSRPTPDGGTHLMGFRDGVVAAVSAYAREQRLLTATAPDFDTDRIEEGLTAVVSVKLEHPEFEGSTRGRLGNAPVRACVRQAVQEHLASWLRAHPQQAAAIIDRLTQEARRD